MATELHHWEFTILPNCSSCFATDNNRKLALPAGTWPVKLNVLIVLAGTISVTIATMAKTDRNHTSEVYVVGFVPTYVLPKKRAIPLDPFLAPLCAEIIDGFIQGEVEIVPLNKNKAVIVAVLDSLSLNVIITVGIDVEYWKLVIPHISPKLVFQAGDAVMVSRYDGDRERVLSVVVSDTHRVIVEGDIYCQIGTHQATGYSAVKLDKSRVFVLAERLLRKAILVPQAGHHCYFLLLDYMRPYPVTSSSSVFVPVYVEPNDMILVKGDHNDVWYGRVVGCDSIDKTKPICVNFYIESPRHSNQFKRESRRIDEVHMNSVVGIAEGRWTNDFSKWIANN